MTTMHPHWDTEEGAMAVPVKARPAQRAVLPASAVSRRPAAIAGIAIVLMAGAALFLRDQRLPVMGQVAGAADIRITPEGFNPPAFAIAAGQTITWVNEDTIPHILASTNLPTANGLLESPPIFPGQRFTVTVPEDAPEDDYTYISRTSASLNGSLSVSALSAVAQNEPGPETPVIGTTSSRPALPAPNDERPTDWESVDQTPTRPPRTGLPTNPYTVATAAYRSGGAGMSAQSSMQRLPTVTTGQVAAAATPPAQYHRPATQPSSGMDTWMLLGAGTVAVWVLARRTTAPVRAISR